MFNVLFKVNWSQNMQMSLMSRQYGRSFFLCFILVWLSSRPDLATATENCEAEICYLGSSLLIAKELPLSSSLPDVLGGQNLFQLSTQAIPNIGFSDHALWLKAPRGLILAGANLVIDNANLNSVTLYQHHSAAGWQQLTLGTYHSFSSRPIKLRPLVFPISTQLSSEHDLYIRVLSKTAISIPIYQISTEELITKSTGMELWAGLFIGVLLAIAFYHLVIYFVVWHISYLFFSVSVIFYALFLAAIQGFLQQWIFSELSSDLVNRFMSLAFSISSFFFISFLKIVLKTKSFALFWHRVLHAIQLTLIALLPCFVWLDYRYMGPLSVYFSVILTLVCAITTCLIAWKGYRPARLFMLMWAAFVVAAALRTVRLLGIGPVLIPGEWGMQIGSILGVLFLATALAQRIKMIKEAEHIALNYAMKIERSAKYELEKKVALRTRDLKIEKDYLEYLSTARVAFFTHINHEIRTPTTALLQYLSFLKRGVGCSKPDATQLEYLDVIENNAGRIHRLTNQLLDLEKVQALESQARLGDLELADIVEATMARLKALFQPGVELAYDIPAHLGKIKGNSEYLESILENLLSNAARYTKQGVVKIRTEPLSAGSGSSFIKVIVQDSGSGIREEDSLRIFRPFESDVSPDASGTGIGLATCKTLVARMGGEIGYEPNPEGGSIFWFTLRTEQ